MFRIDVVSRIVEAWVRDSLQTAWSWLVAFRRELVPQFAYVPIRKGSRPRPDEFVTLYAAGNLGCEGLLRRSRERSHKPPRSLVADSSKEVTGSTRDWESELTRRGVVDLEGWPCARQPLSFGP